MSKSKSKGLSKKEIELILFKIEAHGFFSAMYERLFNIKDERFNELKRKFLDAEKALQDYIDSEKHRVIEWSNEL